MRVNSPNSTEPSSAIYCSAISCVRTFSSRFSSSSASARASVCPTSFPFSSIPSLRNWNRSRQVCTFWISSWDISTFQCWFIYKCNSSISMNSAPKSSDNCDSKLTFLMGQPSRSVTTFRNSFSKSVEAMESLPAGFSAQGLSASNTRVRFGSPSKGDLS